MHILTFDIEDWFHILDNPSTESEAEWSNYESRIEASCDRILHLLDDCGLTATFFVLGWVARKHPTLVRRIAESGHGIGTHSDMHQLVYRQSGAEFCSDLERSVASLEQVIGEKVTAYRAPGFSIKGRLAEFHDALLSYGITDDCSIFPTSRAHGGLKDFPSAKPCILRRNGSDIREYPMSYSRLAGRDVVFSGGGYFRLMPYWLIRQLSNRADYVMTYFHPRDFDPDQPVLGGLSATRRFKSYYGLGASYRKLATWLRDTRMMSLTEAKEAIDWDRVPIVDLS